MKLAWKYIQFYRWRSIVFVAILSVVMALPFISQALTGYLVENIDRRTDSSPIIVSSRAGKIRQTLSTLFFLGSEESTTFKYDVFDEIAEKEGEAIPLLLKHTTKYGPLVATEIDYFAFRNLTVLKGNLFALPSDAVIGSSIAMEHGVKVGDRIKIQSNDLYDISNSAPIELMVTGVLDQSRSPDDTVVFTSLQSVWILEGFLHSHSDQDRFKKTTNGETRYSKSLKINQNFSEKNLTDFHYHSSLKSLPITHVIYRGNTHKSEVLLMDLVNQKDGLMAYRPAKSMKFVVQIFLRLEQFFKAYHVFWTLGTLLMIALIFGLIVQARNEEFNVLICLGASNHFVWLNLVQLVSIYLAMAALSASLWYHFSLAIMRTYFL
ncbi:MAG: hypothetical protein HRU09_18800 [Oligoflexales bacterium]|nr:hypothetical protein [Oligoflexales bacterium]